MFTKRPEWARAKTAFEGKRYRISCSWHGDGEVFSYDENRIALKFHNEPAPNWMMYGLIRLPEFVVQTEDQAVAWQFQRKRRLLPEAFEIHSAGNRVGKVTRRIPILRSYEVTTENGIKWNLSLPLFSVGFFGTSSAGGKLLFWLKTHRLWQLVVEEKHDSAMLMASLAFIHREYLRHQ